MRKAKEKDLGEFIAKSAEYWDNVLKNTFWVETDRGAAILAASLFEVALEALLKAYFAQISSNKDDLFDGPIAPLSTFYSKITIAYRIRLISQKFSRDLDIIRGIRNYFAHTIQQRTFEDESIKSKVNELASHPGFVKAELTLSDNYPHGTRGLFLAKISWMLWYLHVRQREIVSQSQLPCVEEFGYQ